MSDLLNSASLVMIPSGYKEDTVFSAIPTDGSGDLSFTRASNGTRVNSAGLVEVCPWNLLEQSETFENSTWIKNQLSVSANSTTAPNGTTTADTLTTTATTQCQCIQNINFQIGNYTLLFYVKKVDLDFTYVELGNSFCWVNLTTGAITGSSQFGTGWTFVSASASNVGNGWLKVEMVAACSISGTYGVRPLHPVPTSGSYNSLATNKATYLWGAQVNIGSTAKPYFPTTDRLNVPRLTYQNGGGGCPSLLLEPQRTNLNLWSEDFTQWSASNATVTANNTTSPDGTQNADRIQFTGAGFLLGAIQVSGTVYTISCYAKRNGSGTQSIGFFKDGSGAVDSAWALTSDWQRFTYTYTASNNSRSGIAGVNGGDVFVWGAQFEAGAYPTTYIPTTTAQATRVADSFSRNNIYTNGLISASGGTWFVELLNNVALSRDNSNVSLYLGDNLTPTNGNGLYLVNGGGTDRLTIWKRVSGSGGFLYTTITSTVKMAIKWNGSTADVFVNGTKVVSASSFTTTLMEYLYCASGGPCQTEFISQMDLFPTPLTDAECIALTTL